MSEASSPQPYIEDFLQTIPHLPNVWGEGALFAFSGVDGPTDTRSQYVATFTAERYGLLIHTPYRRVLTLALPDTERVRIATGDVLAVDTAGGALLLTFSAWHTLVGALPAGAQVSLRFEVDKNVPPADACTLRSVDERHGDALVLRRAGKRLALAFGASPEEAEARAEAGLNADIVALVRERLRIYAGLPALDDPRRERLLKKCVSVMKVNTLAPEGVIATHWSTPDRVPHRHMWLWDSVFHALAMNDLDAGLAWEFLQAVLDRQRADGMIPHMMETSGKTSAMTQPPLLAWGVWSNYRVTGDRERLAYALPRLEAYLDWNVQHRDKNANGLLGWLIEDNETCRSGESGMDNSQRFDTALVMDGVDFSVFQAQDMACVARIAAELGRTEAASRWQARAVALSRTVHALLWNEVSGFYYDRDMAGNLSFIKAVTGFLPLLLEDVPPERVPRLVAHLQDPSEFASTFPIPSVAMDTRCWSTDMWRGAAWINMNYLVVAGLRRHGQDTVAQAIVEKTLDFVNRAYEQYGVIFEFYDAKDEVPPVDCDRKGPNIKPYNIRVKMDSIRDYHWSAALVAKWLLRARGQFFP